MNYTNSYSNERKYGNRNRIGDSQNFNKIESVSSRSSCQYEQTATKTKAQLRLAQFRNQINVDCKKTSNNFRDHNISHVDSNVKHSRVIYLNDLYKEQIEEKNNERQNKTKEIIMKPNEVKNSAVLTKSDESLKRRSSGDEPISGSKRPRLSAQNRLTTLKDNINSIGTQLNLDKSQVLAQNRTGTLLEDSINTKLDPRKTRLFDQNSLSTLKGNIYNQIKNNTEAVTKKISNLPTNEISPLLSNFINNQSLIKTNTTGNNSTFNRSNSKTLCLNGNKNVQGNTHQNAGNRRLESQSNFVPNPQQNPFLKSPKTASSSKYIGEHFQEAMDWSPIPEEVLITNIQDVRMKIYDEIRKQPFHLQNSRDPAMDFNMNENERINKKDIYVILDTNVFINKLQTISNILHITYEDNSCPVVYVPWTVLQELDYFKDGYSISEKHEKSFKMQDSARRAIKFIHENLTNKKGNFKGQSVLDATEHYIRSNKADDSILSCCLQIRNKFETILVSSDINLLNKATLSGINAIKPEEIIPILRKSNTKKKVNVLATISTKLSRLFSVILPTELKSSLGETIYKAKGFSPLPWSLKQCLEYMMRYYFEILDVLQKQAKKSIKDFHTLITTDSEPRDQFLIEMSLAVLFYFNNGFPKYKKLIVQVIDEIKLLEKNWN